MLVCVCMVCIMCLCLSFIESPPTYEKIFGVGEMKNEMKDAASGNKGMFALKFIQILCGSG